MDGERAAAAGPAFLPSGRGGGGGGGPADFVALLPPEVSSRIFSDLDVESLCHASVTCKGWHRVIESNDRLWRHHCLSVRAVCQREIDCDRGNGYSWKVKAKELLLADVEASTAEVALWLRCQTLEALHKDFRCHRTPSAIR